MAGGVNCCPGLVFHPQYLMESITHVPDAVAKIAFVSTTKRERGTFICSQGRVRATILVMASSLLVHAGKATSPAEALHMVAESLGAEWTRNALGDS